MKSIIFILTLAALLSISACGNMDNSTGGNGTNGGSSITDDVGDAIDDMGKGAGDAVEDVGDGVKNGVDDLTGNENDNTNTAS